MLLLISDVFMQDTAEAEPKVMHEDAGDDFKDMETKPSKWYSFQTFQLAKWCWLKTTAFMFF